MSEATYTTLENDARALIVGAKSSRELKAIEQKLFGRQGTLTQALRSLGNIQGADDRRRLGAFLNDLKETLRSEIEAKTAYFMNQEGGFNEGVALDVTALGLDVSVGRLHPLTKLTAQLTDIFKDLGFAAVEGPEVETDFYNFTALNIPPQHPARDLWSTFWLESGNNLLLRTHTSPMQIRYMQKQKPPFRIIVPGKTYRYEAIDRTHDIQFTQLEGLMVDRHVTVANFRAIISAALGRAFSKSQTAVRLRPSYFPFVEPGFEVDMACVFCNQKGCDICKHSGWIEMAGAGLVHPHVFEAAGLDPKQWQGFAFGMGLERLAMLKFGINDIRYFRSGDISITRHT